MAPAMDIKFEFVTSRMNRDGTVRYYFRRRGQPLARLPDPKCEEFPAEYRRLLEWGSISVSASEGTFAWLCDQYMDTTDFKSKAKATRDARRRIIMTMTKEPLRPGSSVTFGAEKAKNIGKRHIEILRDRKADSPNAANERLKILSQVFKMGVSRGWVDANHVRDVERLRVPRGGHDTATDEHIAKYLAFHKEGQARLAMLILREWGVRVSDLRILGRQHMQNGLIVFETTKTGVLCELPITAGLASELPKDRMVFLASERGAPFASDKALSQRVAKWFRQAGIKGVTAHSVRKWLATKMANDGATEFELMAWFGWRDPKEARPYVQAANRRRLATGWAAKSADVKRARGVTG